MGRIRNGAIPPPSDRKALVLPEPSAFGTIPTGMPKNAQYGRWRRVAMQVVLWVIFGGTLALAGYVSHRRAGSLNSDLAAPVTVGRLKVRLPSGWERIKPPDSDTRQALVVQEHDEEGRQRRELWITQERQAQVKKGPTYYLETEFKLRSARPEPFEFLGSRGTLITFRGIPQEFFGMELDDEIMQKFPDPGLYACTVLKDGLTVTVQVRGMGAYGPSNLRLIRRVADAMTLADGPATSPATPQTGSERQTRTSGVD